LISEIFTFEFTVHKTAIDIRNHVNNVAYLQWCMDAAEAHWLEKTNSEIREKYVWYVLNHEISYKASAFENEILEVQTWIGTIAGVKSERHYKITRIADQKVLVEAKTLWCLLNSKTLRPTKIPEEIRTLFLC